MSPPAKHTSRSKQAKLISTKNYFFYACAHLLKLNQTMISLKEHYHFQAELVFCVYSRKPIVTNNYVIYYKKIESVFVPWILNPQYCLVGNFYLCTSSQTKTQLNISSCQYYFDNFRSSESKQLKFSRWERDCGWNTKKYNRQKEQMEFLKTTGGLAFKLS